MTSTTPTPSIRQLAIGDLEHELAQTRRLLERVPEDRLDWAPHAKSRTLGQIATHLADLPGFALMMVEHEGFDVVTGGGNRAPAPTTTKGLLDRFDANVAALRAAVERASDADLGATWELKRAGHVFYSAPRFAALRTMGISHIVHHRGQCSVYLRLLDVPVPGMYGPSADER